MKFFLLSLGTTGLVQIIVFGGFFMGLYYFSFYNDGGLLRKEIQQIQSQIQTVQGQIKDMERKIEDVLVFKREIESEKEVVEAFLNFIPSSLTFNEVSALIIDQARLSGVNIESKKDVELQKLEDFNYEALSIDIEITGSFYQLMLFLSKLTEQKRILIVEKIEIKPRKDNLVSSYIEILSYRYVDEEKKEGQERT